TRTLPLLSLALFFLNVTPTAALYPLSLHDALPISHVLGVPARVVVGIADRLTPLCPQQDGHRAHARADLETMLGHRPVLDDLARSEEHTSELQSLTNLVCRLLLEKKTDLALGLLVH